MRAMRWMRSSTASHTHSLVPLQSAARHCHQPVVKSSLEAAALVEALSAVQLRIPQSHQHRVSSLQLLSLIREHAPAQHADALRHATIEQLKAAVLSVPQMFDVIAEGGEGNGQRWEVVRAADAVASSAAAAPTSAEPTTSSDASVSTSVESGGTSGSATPSANAVVPPVDPRVHAMEKQIRRALREGAGNAEFTSLKQIAKACAWSRDDFEFVLTSVLPRVLGGSSSESSSSSLLKGLQAKPQVRIRPKLKRRGCHVFTDADGIAKQVAQRLLNTLAVDNKQSTFSVVRHAATGAHTTQDVVTTYDLPPFLVLEKQARMLCGRDAPVLKDVVFVCSDANFNVYAKSIAPKLAPMLKHSTMFVCSPSAVQRFHHEDTTVSL